MRTIRATRSFKRDRRREERGVYRNTLNVDLAAIIELLRDDAFIPERFKDHPMLGDWKGYRNCHLHCDMVLLYRKVGDDALELVRLGSHSELRLK